MNSSAFWLDFAFLFSVSKLLFMSSVIEVSIKFGVMAMTMMPIVATARLNVNTYWMPHAIRNPIGLFVANGNLKSNLWQRK